VRSQFEWLARAALLLCLAGLATPGRAVTRADCERRYTPERGQEGKDVIWVPTEERMVVRILEMAQVTPADTVYDLGAGDGIIPITAGKRFGAKAVGIEYDAALAKYAQCLVEAEGLEDRVRVVRGDIFAADFSEATVVTLYLLPELNLRLRPTLLDMRPGTRVVSYSFSMGDWEPDETADTAEGLAFLWIVPAKAGGTWSVWPTSGGGGFELTLEQTFQTVAGAARGAPVTGRLAGENVDLAFELDGEPARLTGSIEGDRLSATVTRGDASAEYAGARR
jgi:hypothetical protein